ncbi:hypothetical protein FA95DRAFT_1567671 [Auriscalpium vulgare]|uniref:Uncharacterized protein n=2 Tax=Auriscalpium vulgare TaxID=40419 RepID=A0ACB8R0E5_9AGAM|nr:hypothetical protein FA95DRAFT_1568113 [Auriscalpium vulgare]KAI0038592.1 hypothetical protein FA95DRAFT_1567671 [Auriscalpium vulgare]
MQGAHFLYPSRPSPAAPAHIESTPVAFPSSLPVVIVDRAVSPAETAPSALHLQSRGHGQREFSIFLDVQPYAALVRRRAATVRRFLTSPP